MGKKRKMKKQVIGLIRKHCMIYEKNITEKTQLKNISLDSLSFIAMLVELESLFKIEFESSEWNLDHWNTVGELINAVREKKCKRKYCLD